MRDSADMRVLMMVAAGLTGAAILCSGGTSTAQPIPEPTPVPAPAPPAEPEPPSDPPSPQQPPTGDDLGPVTTRGLDVELSVSVSPRGGAPGTPVSITIGGTLACFDPETSSPAGLTLSWGSTGVPVPETDGGDVVVSHTVSRSDTGTVAVTAACGQHQATDTFTVLAPPTLSLTPDAARPGERVTVSGSDFVCDGPVELQWDAATVLARAEAPQFSVPITVPADAAPRQHMVVALCGSQITTRRPLTVTEAPVTTTEPTTITTPVRTTEPTTTGTVVTSEVTTEPAIAQPPRAQAQPNRWSGLLVTLLVIAAVLTGRDLRRRYKRHQAGRISVTTRANGPPLTTLRQTSERGETSHAIRVEVRHDPGIRTVKEVHDERVR